MADQVDLRSIERLRYGNDFVKDEHNGEYGAMFGSTVNYDDEF